MIPLNNTSTDGADDRSGRLEMPMAEVWLISIEMIELMNVGKFW